MSNPPRIRKRVGADPSKLKRGVDGSGFIKCEKCGFSVPAGAADVHDCKLDARVKSCLECHHTIESAEKRHSRFRNRKQQRTEEVEIEKAPKCAKKQRDPNRPKKPQTSFFVFMEEFRRKYKEVNADAKGVNKQGADKWFSMTEEEKKPYYERAHALKMEYKFAMVKYLEKIRQDNEEADSAEVGKIDMAAELSYSTPAELSYSTPAEFSYEDYLNELDESSDSDYPSHY